MKIALYNFFIFLYKTGAIFISTFNAKAKLFIKGRKGLLDQIKNAFSQNQHSVAWFHCASLGEFEQGKPVIEAFKATHSEHRILVTFFSPSGYEQKKNYEGADFVFYLPLDTKANAIRFLDLVQPDFAFFIKYEFWFHYLRTISERKIKLYNISGLFTENHAFFKAHGTLQRQMLGFFDHFFVQDSRSKALLEGIQITNVSISGDTRFDRVLETIGNPNHYPLIEEFKGENRLIIIGSSWPEDIKVLSDFINNSADHIRFLIAPHLIGDDHVQKLEQELKVNSIRYTKSEHHDLSQSKVMIINTIGMLSSIYQYGEIAYIGGAFRDGVHNILEAVAFGLPVIFGDKNLDKFPETLELMERGGAFSISNQSQVQSVLNKLLTDSEHLKNASEICRHYVSEKAGATKIIMNHINQG